MDNIVTQDVYLPVYGNINSTDIIITTPTGKKFHRLHTGMVVLTEEQFEKAIADAFDEGERTCEKHTVAIDSKGFAASTEINETRIKYDKEQYINSVIDNRPTVENPMDYAKRIASILK